MTSKRPKLTRPTLPGDDDVPDWGEDPTPDDPDPDDVMVKPRNPALKPRKRRKPAAKRCRLRGRTK